VQSDQRDQRKDGGSSEEDLDLQAERRRSSRADLAIRVEYQTIDALFTEFTSNINEGGLFIETDRPALLDETVALHFCLPGQDDPIKATGRVVRLSAPHEPKGMAVQFEELGAAAQLRINEMVRELRTERV